MNATLEVVILPVSDPDKSLDFYRDKLGFAARRRLRACARFSRIQLTPQVVTKDVDGGRGRGASTSGSIRRERLRQLRRLSDPDGNTWVLQERGHRDA